ncbi:MAG: hypothetical protein M3291_02800 [Actinomycetota bacterium]|nr:hypothetical protein [Actinomycetota bacterium]
MILTNGLFSFRAECIKNDFVNAVSAFIYQDGLDLQGAIDKLCDVIDTREQEFLAKRDQLLAGATGQRPDVQAYVAALGYMMSGNLHWSYLTPPLPRPRPRLERLDLRNRHPAPGPDDLRLVPSRRDRALA